MKDKKQAISPAKKAWGWVKSHKKLSIAIVVILLISAALFSPNSDEQKNNASQEEKSKYPEVDVNGLTISKACEKLREKGWKIGGVDGVDATGTTVESSDCSDEKHKANDAFYYASDWNSNVRDKVTVYFSSDKKAAAKEEKEAQTQTPKYDVVETKYDIGVAKNTEYYVLVKPFDLSNDGFKKQAKAIFSDIAKTEGKSEFSAKIYTSKEVLEYDYEPTLPHPDGFSASDDDIKENQAYVKSMAKKKETTLVASYIGGVDLLAAKASKSDNAYSITWFGAAFTDQPKVGKYVGDEQWKP